MRPIFTLWRARLGARRTRPLALLLVALLLLAGLAGCGTSGRVAGGANPGLAQAHPSTGQPTATATTGTQPLAQASGSGLPVIQADAGWTVVLRLGNTLTPPVSSGTFTAAKQYKTKLTCAGSGMLTVKQNATATSGSNKSTSQTGNEVTCAANSASQTYTVNQIGSLPSSAQVTVTVTTTGGNVQWSGLVEEKS